MSICHSCLALRVDGEDTDRTRATLTRWCMKRAGYVSQDALTDEELLRLPDPRIEDCRRQADEIICLLIGLKYRPTPTDAPPF